MNRSLHNSQFAGVKVLVVEDDRDSATILERRLGSRGFEVLVSSDGAAAIELAVKERPQIILMDINLPGMDGCEATRQLRQRPESANIPIIGISSLAFAEDRKRALSCGCVDYETKPLEFHRLLTKMYQYLGYTPPVEGGTTPIPNDSADSPSQEAQRE